MTRSIPLSKGAIAIVDEEDFIGLIAHSWCLSKQGYAVRHEARLGRRHPPMILMHRVLAGAKEGQYVDHINGNKTDNRKSNLRICSNAENVRRRGKFRKGVTSKFKGVCWIESRGKWHAQIKVDYKTKFIGSFDYEFEAAEAYNQAAKKYHGEFAGLNPL